MCLSLNVCVCVCVFACVCPQRVRDNRDFVRALTYQSSDSLLDGVAVTET